MLNPDVLLRCVGGAWLLSNPRLRTHVEVTPSAGAGVLEGATGVDQTENGWLAAIGESAGRDRTQRAIGGSGLHADHSGLADGGGRESVCGKALLDLLRRRGMLVASPEAAFELVRPLRGLLDRESLGTFHQRVGQQLFVDRRVRVPWREWHDQKFSPDGRELLESPYRRLQLPFFDAYFSAEGMRGRDVLDFGCGNGFFASRFAALGANVVAVDNSEELLAIAQANHRNMDTLELVLTRSFDELFAKMDEWGPGSFDLIYLQDTLLLLLNPEHGEPSPQVAELLTRFRQLLRDGGSLCAMEPDPVFWLANRYGAESRPYAIVTEYRQPVFNVAPTLDLILSQMAVGGFALKEMRHPALSEAGEESGGYAREFPIWDFFVFVRA